MKLGLSRTIAIALIVIAIIPATIVGTIGYLNLRNAAGVSMAKELEVVAASVLEKVD